MAEVLGFRVWVDGGQVDRDSFVTTVYFAYPNRSDRLRLRVGARVHRFPREVAPVRKTASRTRNSRIIA
jgi:hypothetical protein